MSNKPHRKAPVAPSRTSKTNLHRRGLSLNVHGSGVNSRSASSSRKPAGLDHAPEASEDEMAGLPQFCTTCDKQIVTPGNSILYCSEACRRRDASRPISLHSALSTPSSIPSAASYFDLPEPEIIPPRSPTMARPGSFIFQDRGPSSDRSSSEHETDNEDDAETPVSFHFHSHSYTEQQRRQRSAGYRTSLATTDGIPSLSHTPSSSVGTAASYDRPLARRYRPLSGTYSAKSVDLVTPSLIGQSPTEQRRGLESASLASSTSAKTAFRKRSMEEDG